MNVLINYIIILLIVYLLLQIFSSFSESYEEMNHEKDKKFDIVIPVGPDDSDFLNTSLKYTTRNIIGYNNIYLIVHDDTLEVYNNIKKEFNNVYIINEKIFPFSKSDIREENSRSGWYLQQLLKLYSGFVIPNILDKYLVIDSDTCFLKPTHFIENNIPLYNYGDEYHEPYFKHMKRMHGSLYKKFNDSGICHHMMFDKYYIKKLFDLVENHHNLKFWKVFINSIDDNDFRYSGASEYEMYLNFMMIYYPDQIKIRKLSWKNDSIKNLYDLNENKNFDYISYHWYMR